jgi:aspartyl-tRNA(Asn)/glutamyl-tRNA(Gln) amidotransferase subunit A
MTRRELIAVLLASLATGSDPEQEVTPAQDLTSLTVADALAAIAAKKITPVQLTEAYLARIQQLNPELNAYITVTAAHARADARRPSTGRLAGIPIAHKDLFETTGIRTTAGSRLFDEHIPTANAAIVETLERAGAVLLGKTNTHELGGGVTTINPFFGTTRNPIDRSRIPGGSSGGSASAVAARMCAAATGSDTGGSVRIPAAFCGCVGFKPTVGRISTAGLLGASPTFDHVGFLTRTVEDAELMFRAAVNERRGGSPPVPAAPDIRLGIAGEFFFDGLEPGVDTAISHVLEQYRERGVKIRDIDFPINSRTMAQVFDPIIVFEIWSRFAADWRATPSAFSKSFAGFFQTERPTVRQFEAAQAALAAYRTQVDRVFDQVDAIVTPTVAVTAPPIAGPIDGGKILRNTWPFNAAGTPAISIPCPTAGLPVGLQLIARRGDDDKLLQIARTLAGV